MPVGQAKDRRTMLVRFELEFGPQIGVRRTMRPGFMGIRYRRVPRVGGTGTTAR